MNLKFLSPLRFVPGFIMIISVISINNGEVIKLNSKNINDVKAKTGVLFLNFYADWCRFSNLLEPIFAEAAAEIKKEFPAPGLVEFGKIDCDSEATIAQEYHISKYPTLKLVVNGQAIKKEFRGQRSKESIVTFIKKYLTSPIVEYTALADLLGKVDKSKSTVIGYFHSKNNPDFQAYERAAKQLRDECRFAVAYGNPFVDNLKFGNNIRYKPQNEVLGENDETYSGPLNDVAVLTNWIQQKCIPLIREITFDNAEELTEEGLMFLILFRRPDDRASLDLFTEVIKKELDPHKSSINVLHADGIQFQHPLHHLGKSKDDLPLIAIDSFKHMYSFPSFNDIKIPGKIEQFVKDLHSGKLHREFHYGPDTATEEATVSAGNDAVKQATKPPKSVFKNLQPSNKRYTVLEDKDEL